MTSLHVFMLLLCYPLIDASTKATMLCSGSGSVLIEEKNIYYCPDEPNILTFQCDVQDSNILLWRVSPSNKMIRMGAFTDVNELLTDGYTTAFLKEVQKNSDFSKNNFTSIMLLDTKDLVGPITTVSCETSDAERFDSHYLISLDDGPSPFNDFSVFLDEQSGSLTAYLKWDYPGSRSHINGYQTVIRDETEVFHNRTLERNTNDTSCTLSSLGDYRASVQALSRCTGHHPVMEIRVMDRSMEGAVGCSMQMSREYSNEGSSTPLTVGLTVGLAAVLVLFFLTPDVIFSEKRYITAVCPPTPKHSLRPPILMELPDCTGF